MQSLFILVPLPKCGEKFVTGFKLTLVRLNVLSYCVATDPWLQVWVTDVRSYCQILA